MKDKEYINTSEDFINEVQRKQEALEPAVDDMRQRLNEVIASHQLRANGVLGVLAKLSAAYVRRIQIDYKYPPEKKDTVTNLFLAGFQLDLDLFELQDLQRQMKKDWN